MLTGFLVLGGVGFGIISFFALLMDPQGEIDWGIFTIAIGVMAVDALIIWSMWE